MTERQRSDVLRLKANDAEGLKILGACLQDAIVPITEMGYLPEEASFVMVANRFKWEAVCDETGPFERTNCAVRVLGVTSARRRQVDLLDRSLILNLLTLVPADDGVELIFAGGSAIRLTAPSWCCLIEDIGEPWPTDRLPRHVG